VYGTKLFLKTRLSGRYQINTTFLSRDLYIISVRDEKVNQTSQQVIVKGVK
jgi:hypothetical protein